MSIDIEIITVLFFERAHDRNVTERDWQLWLSTQTFHADKALFGGSRGFQPPERRPKKSTGLQPRKLSAKGAPLAQRDASEALTNLDDLPISEVAAITDGKPIYQNRSSRRPEYD